jgi:putative Ca2+/H+ antiporter (TMEM165/GDT1 family)
MEWKIFLTIIGTVFVAELGDKTQLATMLFASDKEISPWLVFAASSIALVLAAGLCVLAGASLSQYIDENVLSYIAGVAFILIGAFTIYQA